MKKKLSLLRFGKFLSGRESMPDNPNFPVNLDVREEYANAFRTESYIEFWTRVLDLTHGDAATSIPMESTTAAARLPSYRLFAEHLLDPDQPAVTKILALSQPQNHSENHSLLTNYFSETANASLLCGLLLKDIDQTRTRYHPLKTTIESLDTTKCFPVLLDRLAEFSNSLNPFDSSASSPRRVQAVQASCNELLKQLELRREKARAQLQLVNGLKRGSAIFLVVLTASVVIIAATHAFAMLVAVPGFVTASLKLASTRRLARMSAQLDAAAKGTYILNRDLETISRLVARLDGELEHVHAMVRFWLERRDDQIHAIREVARQLRKNNSSFSEQLDELEEHLYLCFMTINRARSLVVKEVLELSKA
ncbi:PREDICTED: UPF0496 protein At3g49070 [Nelumbo nucifera]|uniref:Uncharacterized protein n=2 Tax=Nelumbo nucifera TaxID=4432 RepID=A0A822ZZD7_NELNU|nr:PREDICTED: UPF0496 protein At3g49070 [Nelumbo nucifera]DAD47318.1 TPA_asm: hypothetical protein HUJ06_017255 [Nelumbo nucifera]